MTTSSRRPHRVAVEAQMCRRREKEHLHQATWGGMTRYYKTQETKNGKHEEWTSPRYYESQGHLVEERKKEREKREALERRRERLRKLLEEEERSYCVEVTVKTRDKWRSPGSDEIPKELLKEVNVGLKIREEERRRHEAELSLYHRWRNDNPTLREYERCLRSKELKLSWLDQQIEKRMRKEREQQECERLLEERDRRLEELKEEEERERAQLLEKKERLKEDLERQMEEVQRKQELSERLKKEEEEKTREQMKIEEVEEVRRRESERRKKCEVDLFNIRHHKLKLKRKAQEVEENLKNEQELLKKLQEAQLAQAIEDEVKRQDWRQTIERFSLLLKDQRDLEKKRQKYLDFVFESEAKHLFEKQNVIWNAEKNAREQLLADVLETVKSQIRCKVEECRKKQLETLKEREEGLKRLEEYNEELRRTEEEEERKKEARRRELEAQMKEKREIRRKLKTLEQKSVEVELEKARKEEERLKMEILKLQRKQEETRAAAKLPSKFY